MDFISVKLGKQYLCGKYGKNMYKVASNYTHTEVFFFLSVR